MKVSTSTCTINIQCLQCVTPPLKHAELARPRQATEQNNGVMIKLGDVHYQTEPNLLTFPKELLSTTTSVSVYKLF